MSSGKVMAPMMAPNAVPMAAIHSGLTHAATTSAVHAGTAGAAAHAGAGAVMATVTTAAGVAILAVGAAATAVVMTRVVMGGVRDFGESIVTGAEEWLAQQAAAEEWQGAVLAVVEVNARIATLRAASRQIGAEPDPDLPEPLNPAGLPLPQLWRWCKAADARLARAEERQADGVVAAGMAWLSEQPGRRTVTSEEELARKVAHARRLEVAAKARMPDAPPNDRSDITAVVERVLGRMAPDTSAQQAATLIEAADKALSSGNAAVARTWLGELRAREQVVDAAVRERRAGIEAAVRYLAALRLEDVSPDLFPSGAMEGFAPVVNRLEAVAAGDRPLTAELRREAEDAVLQAQDLADQCMNTETLAAACAALGYRVRRGSDRALMEITRDEWGEDRVRFNLSEGQLTATFGAADADTPATVIDAGRLRRWKDDFELLRANADENGLSLNLISTVEPDELSSDVEGADVDDADADMEPEKRRRTAAAREKERPR